MEKTYSPRNTTPLNIQVTSSTPTLKWQRTRFLGLSLPVLVEAEPPRNVVSSNFDLVSQDAKHQIQNNSPLSWMFDLVSFISRSDARR